MRIWQLSFNAVLMHYITLNSAVQENHVQHLAVSFQRLNETMANVCVMESRGTRRSTQRKMGQFHMTEGTYFSALSSHMHRILGKMVVAVTWPPAMALAAYTDSLFACPTNETILNKWLQQSGSMFSVDTKHKIMKNPTKHQLAYWHFFPKDRYFDESDSKWKLVKAKEYVDPDGKVWKTPYYPPPNNCLKSFVNEFKLMKEARPHDRWMEKELPGWIGRMRYVEKMHMDVPRDPEKSPVKKEYLVFSVYAHCGFTEEAIAPLFGVHPTTVHNIIYAWSNLLDDIFSAWFPAPTRSQLLRSYPISLYRKWGDCRMHHLLDACEIHSQDAARLAVHAALFSTYKNHCTLKFLAGCDGIGTTWWDLIPDGFPGAITDPIMTVETKYLLNCPFGMDIETDKGFIVDNEGAKVGTGIKRPQKFLKSQVQQLAEDTVHTEKVGNTRIPIEQLNGTSKAASRYFRGPVPILQLGLASKLFCISYLMQNFKYGVTQGRSGSCENCPCKAEIRWYGNTEDGLFDACPFPKLWATNTELRCWNDLRLKYSHASDTDISEMVLSENIPDRLRKEHFEKLCMMKKASATQ